MSIPVSVSVHGQDRPSAGCIAYWGVSISGPSGGYDLICPRAMPLPEAKAVSHLMGAAPAMLAALKDCAHYLTVASCYLDGTAPADFRERMTAACVTARAVIAAAKGDL